MFGDSRNVTEEDENNILKNEIESCLAISNKCKEDAALMKKYNVMAHVFILFIGTLLNCSSPILAMYPTSQSYIFVGSTIIFPFIIIVDLIQAYYSWLERATKFSSASDVFIGLSNSANGQFALPKENRVNFNVYMTNFNITKTITLSSIGLKIKETETENLVVHIVNDNQLEKSSKSDDQKMVFKGDNSKTYENNMSTVVQMAMLGNLGNIRLS